MNMKKNDIKHSSIQAFKYLNLQAQQVKDQTIGSGLQKGIRDDRVYIMDREHRVLGVVSQDLVAPLPFGGQTLLWLTPSLQVGTLFLLEAWLFTVGGQGPFRPVIEEHFAVPSPSLQMMLPIPIQVPLLTKQIL
ncbi:hypothetical protein F4703DRAFT_1798284 [Phycomyces blakesleeanus]